MELHQKIEGVLFYKASPVKKSELVKIFACSDEELGSALETITQRLVGGATRLVVAENEVQLVTAPELDELIESIRKDEMKRDIGKAGAETLAIILYKGPISRAEIDRIRGVNSSFILRNLMVRGLIERDADGKSRTFSITATLLSHLGVTNKTQLPNYATVLDQLEKFDKEQSESENV